MGVINVCITAIAGVMISLLIKNIKPEIALLISIAIGIVIIMNSVAMLTQIVSEINEMSTKIGIDKKYMVLLLKMTGIAYAKEFACDICKDSGHSLIASQVEIFSKIAIMAISIPVIKNLMEMVELIL